MPSIERTINVTYPLRVHFTENVFGADNPLLKSVLENDEPAAKRVLLVVDESLALAQADLIPAIQKYFDKFSDRLILVCPPLLVEGGERAKNTDVHVTEIHSHIEKHRICRHSYVVGVGGGALLDVVGLAAATAHRGVRHVRIPTTTLGQDDSGVGVKNGINAFGKKNFIGTFAPPFAVINDFALLESLPDRDKRAGYIEAVKVALIRDSEFFWAIENDVEALRCFEPAAMKRLIFRSAELHVNHIATAGDPFEFGSARPLDFGHWSAHKLEQLSNYSVRHGEAVAIGIALDVTYCKRMGILNGATADRILSLIERLGFQTFAKELAHQDSSGQYLALQGLEEFREHLGGELTLTLLRDIGDGFETHQMDVGKVIESIEELEERRLKRRSEVGSLAG